jgi:hypothetical protein
VEVPDLTNPTILAASITLGDGVITLTASEFIDLTAAAVKVDLSKFHLSDISLANDAVPSLLGATSIVETDGLTVSITLTEAQRVLAIEHSATPGGDGVALVFDSEVGGMKDIAQNDNAVTVVGGLLVSEHADLIPPTIQSISIALGTGVVTITASETVDVSNVNLNKLCLSRVKTICLN